MNNKHYIFNNLSLILSMTISIIFFSSCNPFNQRISSIIRDTTCSPPCWENIIPGKTTIEEVVYLLTNIEWIKTDSIKNTRIWNDYESISWTGNSNAGDYSGDIYFSEGITKLISVSPNSGVLKFSNIIAKLGDPESVLAIYTHGERSILATYILYPSKGYIFLDYFYTSNVKSEVKARITENEEVKSIWYFEPTDINIYLNTGPIDLIPNKVLKDGIQNWKGFGEYSFIDMNNE